jgi:hypothetical protein
MEQSAGKRNDTGRPRRAEADKECRKGPLSVDTRTARGVFELGDLASHPHGLCRKVDAFRHIVGVRQRSITMMASRSNGLKPDWLLAVGCKPDALKRDVRRMAEPGAYKATRGPLSRRIPVFGDFGSGG